MIATTGVPAGRRGADVRTRVFAGGFALIATLAVGCGDGTSTPTSPTTPTSLTGAKKLAATAAWLAEPPSRRGFSACGVLMESSAVLPTMRTLMGFMIYDL